VIVCEDLHWADDPLVEMLRRLAARSLGPALLVTTARPEFEREHPDFVAPDDQAASISLRPLTIEESGELVGLLLPEAALPRALRDEVLGKAEGNPLFLEELLRRLIDEGALIRDGDHWRTTPGIRTTALPDTIHALLAARLDALPGEEKRVLQEASVVGRTFWEEPVSRAVGHEIGGALQALDRKGFLEARRISSFAGRAEFQFQHALIRDVAYSSLPRARRARAHADHAAWIDEVAGDRRAEFAELIAHHYATALIDDADLAWYEEPERRRAIERDAFDALMFAGTVARRRYALRRAAELHANAVALGPTESARASALEALGAPAGKVTKADVRQTYSYLDVAEEDVAAFEALSGKIHGEKALKIERAKKA